MTLYTPDQEAGGKIRCTGPCESFWTPLEPAGNMPPVADGNTGRLAVIKRPDGTRQVTADGRPLYSPYRAVGSMSHWRLYDYGPSANCYKVRLALAQLGVGYERVPTDIFDGATLTEEYGRINPARETPVLEVDGRMHLPESGAILTYVADGTPLLPDDRWLRAQIMRWLLFEQTAVMSQIGGLRFRLLAGLLAPDAPGAVRRREAGIQALRVLDGHLSATPFLVGERYTIADIGMYGYVHVAGEAGMDLAGFPAVTAWLERVEQQPGHINDLEPYPDNARTFTGRSIYG